jgi:hypothetical protein
LDYAHVQEIIAGGLHEFIDNFQTKLNDVGLAIHETFFAMRPMSREPEHATASAMPQLVASQHNG